MVIEARSSDKTSFKRAALFKREVLEIVDDTDFPTVLWAITWFLYCSLFLGSLIILMIAVLVLFFVGINGINVGVQNLATDE